MISPLTVWVALGLTGASAEPGPVARPSLAMVVTARRGVSEQRARTLLRVASDTLAAEGVPIHLGPRESVEALARLGLRDGTDCEGKRQCVAEVGRVLGVWAVVAIELAELDGAVAMHLELIDSSEGERRAEADAVLKAARVGAELPGRLAPFAQELKRVLEPVVAPVAVEEPPPAEPSANLEPVPELTPLTVVSPTPPPPSRLPVIAVGAAGVVALVVAAVCFGLGAQARAQLDQAQTRFDGQVAWNLSRSEAAAWVQRGNTAYTFSLIGVLAAGALFALTPVMWLKGATP